MMSLSVDWSASRGSFLPGPDRTPISVEFSDTDDDEATSRYNPLPPTDGEENYGYAPSSPTGSAQYSDEDGEEDSFGYTPTSPEPFCSDFNGDEVDEDGFGYAPTSPEPFCSDFNGDEDNEDWGLYAPSPPSSSPPCYSNGDGQELSLKRKRDEDSDDEELDGFDSEDEEDKNEKKTPRKFYKFMETCDSSTARRKVKTLKANYYRLLKKKIPIAANHRDCAFGDDSGEKYKNPFQGFECVSKLKELMDRWSKLEEAQSRLNLDREQLIREHTQLVASWSLVNCMKSIDV